MPNPVIRSSSHPILQSPKLVLFDIDGTLIIGRYPVAMARFDHIFQKYLGHSAQIDWDNIEPDGSTDLRVLKETLKREGMEEKEIEEKIDEIFEEAYNFFAKNIKSDYKKRLMKEGEELVKKLYKRENIYLGLLTGNEENIARLKMNSVGLSDYFRFGLFGNEAEDRRKLARLVFKKAKKFLGIEFLAENIYIIGDTPGDVKCGKSIGAKTIAVATGRFAVEELKKAKPDLAVESLADKRVLKFIVG